MGGSLHRGAFFQVLCSGFRDMRVLRVATVNDEGISGDGCLGDDLHTARALMELSTEEVG